ncbi:MAG: long-chain fatty acid--CoA ligase [Pseudomonadota bacterium]
MTENNIVACFFNQAEKLADTCCFHSKEGQAWQRYTWQEIAASVQQLGLELREKGLGKGDRVAIIGQSSMAWTIADLAVLSCGAITVPIYPTYPVERIKYILENADVSLVFVQEEEEKKRVSQAVSELSHPPLIIVMKEELKFRGNKPTTSLDLSRIHPQNIASIIYTSGTTGHPKGVVLTHENILAEVKAAGEFFKFSKHEIGLMCLPLSHVLGRLMQFHQLAGGYQLAYIEAFNKFVENCQDIRPQLIVGVPRMLEKMQEGITASIEKCSGWKKHLFAWAIKIGSKRSQYLENKKPAPLLIVWQYALAKFLVINKIRSRLGGRLKLFICGGAPLRPDLGRYFHALGLLVLEGYGLTETFAAATVNRPDDFCFGTVGAALPGVEIKLSDSGEVLIRGKTVFREYLNSPKETSEVKLADGWFNTGDIGQIDNHGFLRLTDRKKEIIVTSGGQNIAPQMIENTIMESRYINYCLVYGDKKKYLTALITLNMETVTEYAKNLGLQVSLEELADHPRIIELIARVVEQKNRHFARHETIKRFKILKNDFSQEQGELTPTLKLRRKYITQKYQDVLDKLYSL